MALAWSHAAGITTRTVAHDMPATQTLAVFIAGVVLVMVLAVLAAWLVWGTRSAKLFALFCGVFLLGMLAMLAAVSVYAR